MGTRIQIRRDTSTNWSLNNPVLALGEPGLETDTQIVKYGDGVTTWNSLPYANLNNLADFTTANLAEYSANLYFTNARVYANVDLLDFATNAQVSSFATNAQLTVYATNAQLGSYATNGQLTVYATNAQLGSYATNNQLALYATNNQVASFATNAQLSLYALSTSLDTANVFENNNKYYTNARVDAYLTNDGTVLTLNNTLVLPRYTFNNLPAGVTGAIVFETSNNIFRGYNGTHWVALS